MTQDTTDLLGLQANVVVNKITFSVNDLEFLVTTSESWALPWHNVPYDVCIQWRLRYSVLAQSDLSLRLALHRYPRYQVFYIFTSRISLDVDGNRDDGTRDWVHMYEVTFSRILSQLLTHTNIVFLKLYVTFVCGQSVIMELKYTSVTFCIHFRPHDAQHVKMPLCYMQIRVKKDCLWEQRTYKITKIGDSVWLSLFICNTVQYNLNGSNPDGSFTVDDSNSFLSPYEFLPIAQENKYLRKFSFYRRIVCCVYSLESPHRGDSNEYTQHAITV